MRQWGENMARTLRWHLSRERSGAVPAATQSLCSSQGTAPLHQIQCQIQTPRSAQPREGECFVPAGVAPLCWGLGVVELGGPPRFHSYRACDEKLFLRQKKIPDRGWGGYRSELMTFFFFVCPR